MVTTGGVCVGLGTNFPCRICPRSPATADLLALWQVLAVGRWEVQERVQEAAAHLPTRALAGSAEELNRPGPSRGFRILPD